MIEGYLVFYVNKDRRYLPPYGIIDKQDGLYLVERVVDPAAEHPTFNTMVEVIDLHHMVQRDDFGVFYYATWEKYRQGTEARSIYA